MSVENWIVWSSLFGCIMVSDIKHIYSHNGIWHDNTQNMFWVFDEKYETLSIYLFCNLYLGLDKYCDVSSQS